MVTTNEHLKSGQGDTPQAGAVHEDLPCTNPATGQQVFSLPMCMPDEIAGIVDRARGAFPEWKARSFRERAAVLVRARDIMLDRQNEVLDLLVEETGKARCDAISDLLVMCETIAYFTKRGRKFLKDQTIRSRLWVNKRVVLKYEPRGVVVNISPWNYPLDLAWSPLISALMAGNCVINKPSEYTPRISLKFREILCEAGVPEGVVQVVVGRGEVGSELCRLVDFVCFTGSTATGRKVAALCGANLIPFTLELGGKDPAIVLDDADIERAANGIVWGAFFNSGQTCVAVERVYVSRDVYVPFVEAVVERTRVLRQGIDNGFDVDVGSMSTKAQLEIVESHVQDAREKGAMVRLGGQRNPEYPEGYFYEPTVLTDVDHSMKIMTEETFGPVLPIMPVRDGAEAVELANKSAYGLNSSVWSQHRERAEEIANQLQNAHVCINDCLVSFGVVEAPLGGIKDSGVGSRRGPAEIRKYCNEKVIMRDLFGLKREAIWYPYSPKVSNGLLKLLGLIYRSGIANKIRLLTGKTER